MFEILLEFQPINSKRQKEEISRHVFNVLSDVSDEAVDSLLETMSIKLPDVIKHMQTAKLNWIMWRVLSVKGLV